MKAEMRTPSTWDECLRLNRLHWLLTALFVPGMFLIGLLLVNVPGGSALFMVIACCWMGGWRVMDAAMSPTDGPAIWFPPLK